MPVKDLQYAKTRLSGFLTSDGRRALALAMLTDVLTALRNARSIARIAVISRDPDAITIAQQVGALAWLDHSPDLNGALTQAATQAAADGAAATLVLPADVPLVTPSDIDMLASLLPDEPGVVLAPSRDGGTNALLAHPPLALPFRFGPDSLALHQQSAHSRGLPVRLAHSPGLERDIDIPADLYALAQLTPRTHAQRILLSLGVSSRAA